MVAVRVRVRLMPLLVSESADTLTAPGSTTEMLVNLPVRESNTMSGILELSGLEFTKKSGRLSSNALGKRTDRVSG